MKKANLIIPEIPEIEDEIIEARDEARLAIFIGAGVSTLVGCWKWGRLANELIELCYNTNNLGEPLLNYREYQVLSEIRDHRKLITIAYKILSSLGKVELFYKKMEDALLNNDTDKVKRPNIYDSIARFRCLYITTNADKHFDFNFMIPNIKYRVPDFDPNNIQSDCLYHIHGSIKEKEKMVFTLPSYFEQYRDNGMLSAFLNKIFSEYRILFIGYGLAEFELLEYLFRRYGNRETQIKHFLLQGYFSGEENLVQLDQQYYSDMNIKLIPYSKDNLGYRQLEIIINKWANDMDASSKGIAENLNIIDDAVE